jgi:hypothetical protein
MSILFATALGIRGKILKKIISIKAADQQSWKELHSPATYAQHSPVAPHTKKPHFYP